MRADLYARWKRSRDMDEWAEIAVAHKLLDRAEHMIGELADE